MMPSRSSFREYALAIACVLASTACAYLLKTYVRHADLAMIQLLGIVLASARFSVGASIAACLVGIVAFDFLFIPPAFAITPGDIKSGVVFVAMLVVAAVISGLNQDLRRQRQVARAEAFRAEALFALSSELSRALDAAQLRALTARHLEQLFAAQVTIALRADSDFAALPEAAGAERAFELGEFVASPSVLWAPIAGAHATLGVIGLRLAKAFDARSPEGFLLAACAHQLAMALERVQLAQAVRRTELEAESERVRSALLSAVSHDLKTPLATILAAGTTLRARRGQLDARGVDALLASIVGEAEHLNRQIQNLLSIARLEAPGIELRRTPEAIEEIVEVAVERFSARYAGEKVQVDLPADLPLVSVDPLLTEQVFANLLENAVRHAGRGVSIRITALATPGYLRVQVSDDGPGIPEDERDKVFEKFYRGRGANRSDGGVGLGLTICRAIVRSHGGRITLGPREGGGTLVELTLPLAAAEPGRAAAHSGATRASAGDGGDLT